MIDETTDAQGKRLSSIVHRAAFLRELLSGVPAKHTHVSKRLDRIKNAGQGPVTLHFTDGTTHDCDILVVADGIYSTVRKIILGANGPAANPRNAGWRAVMALKPYGEARFSLGEGPVDSQDAREHQWIGDGTYLLHSVLNQGELVLFVISVRDEASEGSDSWHRVVGAEEIMKVYRDRPQHLSRAVHEMITP